MMSRSAACSSMLYLSGSLQVLRCNQLQGRASLLCDVKAALLGTEL
jgi:hypothetical protein